MALTVNGYRTGRAGATDLADIREYIQIEQEEAAKRRRQEMKERTNKLVNDIASMLDEKEYEDWWTSTPNDNEGFLAACEQKYLELTSQPHPVEQAYAVEKSIVVSAVPVKVTVSRSWAERHLNVDVNGFEAELDKAFGKGKWILA